MIPVTRSSPLLILRIILGRTVCCCVWFGPPGLLFFMIELLTIVAARWPSHRPDMPLYPGGPRLGLGLWNSIAGTMVVELVMFGTGVWLYAVTTRARDRIGHYAFLGYLVLLLMAYVSDRFSGPPASPDEIAWTGLIAGAILLLWAWWFDRHRVSREAV